MVERGQGRVLITSSIASTMPGPHQAVYNASKSFTQSFAEALREELADTGVTVTALMPGPTDTEFFAEADLEDADMAKHRDPAAQVAEQGFEAMMRGEQKVVAGSLMNKVQAKAAAVIPDALKAKVHGKLVQKDGE
jgi:short-subunit dehydrogenase